MTSCSTFSGMVATSPSLWTVETVLCVILVTTTVMTMMLVGSLQTATTLAMITLLTVQHDLWVGMLIHSIAESTTIVSPTMGLLCTTTSAQQRGLCTTRPKCDDCDINCTWDS